MTKKQRKKSAAKSAAPTRGKVKILSQLEGSLEANDTTIYSIDANKQDETTPAKPQPKKRGYFFMGVLVLVMAIVGVISTVGFVIDIAREIADDTSIKKEIAAYIYPLVVNDIPVYERVDNLPESAVISTGIWNIILNEDQSGYEKDGENIIIPAVNVDTQINRLFGQGVKYTHQTVGDIYSPFEYIEDKKSYSVPAKPRYLPYSPYIKEISVVGETYTVKVGYLPPSLINVYETDEGAMPEPEKYMIYTISKNSERSKVESVQFSPDSDEGVYGKVEH